MQIEKAQQWWSAQPGWLNTASYGLPPQPAWDAMQNALADWRVGATSWEPWGASTTTARETFARLVGVPSADVAVGAQVSQMIGPVAASLPDGARVVAPDIEFTSNLFPWLVHEDRLSVRIVPESRIVDAIEDGCDVVAFSLVQSATGQVADYTSITSAARAHGAITVVDATQGCGWLPFDASLADVVVVGAYKWLMSPRGSAFAYLSPRIQASMRPVLAGWFAGDDVHDSYYGPPLRLARDARRFDLSPSWHTWVATAATLSVIEQIGVVAIHDHNLRLANQFRTGLGQPAGDSAIVTVNVADAYPRLASAGVRAAVRAGQVRASFHVYNTEADVQMALDALRRSSVG